MDPDLETLTLNGQLPVFHPGAILKRTVFPRLELSTEVIEKRLELSHSELVKMLDGERAIDVPLAEKIAALVGGTPDVWLRMQASYDLASTRPTSSPKPRLR